MSDFSGLNDWLQRIETQLDDGQKQALMRRITIRLRQQWSQRIRSQVDPSGAGFIPRKAK
ncbi:phage virion morphogenesis protein, partial [Lactococcus lactis]|uniref:phage virion morphogenesis protein n=1 Tax=Lactococcus lactis TaxID=1358 RepID=UPI003EBCD665